MADLRAWLGALGLERYCAAFEAAEVDVSTLPHLTADDLKEIGLPLGPRRRILAARGAPAPAPGADAAAAAERRRLTVMFVDLVGSTRLSRQVDPEVLGELLAGYKSRVAAEIAAAGGRVAKYLGDGVVAYFGWPQAREDAAEASIRCGFQVIEQVARLSGPDGRPLQCRIGAATGLVVVGGEFGQGAAREDVIAGEPPNLAARLQALAAPGTMAICEATRRRAGQLFAWESIGDQAVPGFSTPVAAWRPVRPLAYASRFRAVRAVRTSFVGRDRELRLLSDRWRAARTGTGGAALIVGEAGIGKSRLAEALYDQVRPAPHSFVTWQGSSFHQAKPLYPVVEYLTQAAGVVDAAPPAEKLRRLGELLAASRAASDEGVAAAASPDAALPLFAQLLALPPEAGYVPPELAPNALRAATIEALADWVRRVAVRQPLLLLVEDAHWIDSTTLDLVARLVGEAGEAPLLAVVTARPEFAAPWGGGPQVSRIGLDRLGRGDCEGLVREIAAAHPDAVVREIVARSDGNPLFLEELSAAVFETRAAAAGGVPESLESSLMARLDQLGDAKRAAQVCAVLGRRFARPLLALVAGMAPAVLDQNLSLLVAHDVIRPVGPWGGGRYEFKHALLRDAAYESLLLSRRRRLHEACGRHLQRSFPEVARTEPELLAHHFALAGLPGEASDYAEQAGDRATAAGAFVEVVASYQDALRQAERLPSGPERDRRILALLLKLGPAVSIIDGAQDVKLRELYRRAEALSRTADDRDALFKSVWGLWYNANIGRDLDDAAALAEQLVAISEQSGEESHRLEALHCRWSSALFRGDCVACDRDAAQGAALYDRERHQGLGRMFGGHDPGVCALGCRAQALALAGDFAAGRDLAEAAIALAETLDHSSSLAHALLMALNVSTILRAPDLLRVYAQRMLDLGRRFNVPPQQAMGAYSLAWVEAETGDRARGLEQMAAMHERVTAVGPITMLYKVMYIDQLLRAGHAAAALQAAERAVAELRFPGAGLVLPELYRLRGECRLAAGRPAEAVADLRRAAAMATRDGALLLRLRSAASLYRAEGGEQAREDLAAALAALPAAGDGPDVAEARALLAGAASAETD